MQFTIALIGIDIGTQSLKVVVTGDALEVRGAAARGYEVVYPRPGWAEQDPRAWEAALAPAIAEALARAGAAAAEVRAVGVAGQLDGCVAVDAAGDPLGRCLIWMDRRAADLLPPLDAARFRRKTGLTADGGHMAAKIRWLEAQGGGTAAARFHQPVSYVVERLTGRAVLDHGHASTTMLYALAHRDWDDALLAAFGIDRARLPEVADAAAVAGTLTARGAALAGLPAGTPVAVGTGDDFATPLGAGVIEPGTAACVLGTAEVVGAPAEQPVFDDAGLVETHAYVGGRSFVENPGWLSGGAVAWIQRVLGADSAAGIDALAAAAPPASAGLTFLPALSGAMAPEWIASARGCFYGLTAAHDRAHLARAVLEGCAYAMRDVLDRMRALAVPLERVLLTGGGANSRLWAEIRADIAGVPVQVSPQADACPLGAAMLAAVAAGLQPDVDHCAAMVAQPGEVIAPQPARAAAYADGYAAYRRLFEALRPMY